MQDLSKEGEKYAEEMAEAYLKGWNDAVDILKNTVNSLPDKDIIVKMIRKSIEDKKDVHTPT